MGSIRRKLGAFAAAVAIAAVMVAVPTPIHAKQKTDSLGGFCSQLASSIQYLASLDDNLATAATLASLQATFDTFCQ
jgi:hypothetical protein